MLSPRGWRGEPVRHSLAAKGISTSHRSQPVVGCRPIGVDSQRRYMKMQSIGEMLEVKKTDEEKLFRERQLERVRSECLDDLESAVERGELSAEDAQRFWRDDFESERDLFVRGGQSFEQFRSNTRRKCLSHKSRHARSLPVWSLLEKKEAND